MQNNHTQNCKGSGCWLQRIVRRLLRIPQNSVKNIIQLLPCSLALLGTVTHANGPTEIIAHFPEAPQPPIMDVWHNISRPLIELINRNSTWDHAGSAAAKPLAVQGQNIAVHLLDCETESPPPVGGLAGKAKPIQTPTSNESANNTNEDFFSCRHMLMWWSCAMIGFFLGRIGLIDFLNYVVEEYIWPPNIPS